MELGAFVSLEDISSELPSYREEVIGVDTEEPLAKAYADLEEQIKDALEEHRGNHSVNSTALNALLSYPDRPYGLGDLIGTEYDPEAHRRVPFLIAPTQDLPEDSRYAKERKLIECIKADLAHGRKCQIYAVYTAKRDVTSRLERVLSQEGIRVSVLTSQVPPDQREAWYERRLRDSMQVCVAHPRLVSVGMGFAVVAFNLLRADWILDLHLAAGKPTILANWSTIECGRSLSNLQRRDAGVMSSPYG